MAREYSYPKKNKGHYRDTARRGLGEPQPRPVQVVQGPRFYTGKDIIIAYGREDDSSMFLPKMVLVPVLMRAVVVSVRKGLPSEMIRPLDRTDRVPYIPGTI